MTKLILIAVVLVVVGSIVCGAAAASMQFDLKKLDTGKYETNTCSVNESFRSISVAAADEKLLFRPSEDGKCKVVCFEAEHTKHTVSVTGETLTIKTEDERNLIEHFGIYNRAQEITVYLPERAYADLRIETDTGDVDLPADFSFDRIQIKADTADVCCLASAKRGLEIAVTTGDVSVAGVAAGSMDLTTTTGKIRAESVVCEGAAYIRVQTGKTRLQDLNCGSFTSEGTTGDITLDHVIAADVLSITRDTGDVEFQACDAASVFVQTTTGDVTGTLLSEKVFITETDTGKVEVPKTVAGGRCEISTDTGDIRIGIR